MQGFIYFFMPDKNYWKPYITPEPAKPQDHVTAPYPSEKTGNNNKRKNQQHYYHKSEESIHTVYPAKGFP